MPAMQAGRHRRARRVPGGVVLSAVSVLVFTVGVALGLAAFSPGAPAPAGMRSLGLSHPAGFAAVTGPGCPASGDAAGTAHRQGNSDGWHPVTGVCGHGYAWTYLAMVPGDPGRWHDFYTWRFRTGITTASCVFSLLIPAVPQAGSPAWYWFSAGDGDPDHRIADFTIDQARDRGRWVTMGPFTFPGGTVLIEVTDRGEGPPSASVVAGPARLRCT